jgi:hypothetical protein
MYIMFAIVLVPPLLVIERFAGMRRDKFLFYVRDCIKRIK